MIEYGLFEKKLKNVPNNEKLDLLARLLETKEGVSYTRDLYIEEHRLEYGLKPITVFFKGFTKTRLGNAKYVSNLILKQPHSLFESSLRYSYQKKKSDGESTVAFLNDVNNDEIDGVVSLTIDFDSNVKVEDIEKLIESGKTKIQKQQRSFAFYAQAVSRYALKLKDILPKELEPSSIRFTGRGFQFVYSLPQTYFFNKKDRNAQKLFVTDTIKWLRMALEKENQRFYEDLGFCLLPKNIIFNLDRSFENNLYQLRRVPGTINPKTGMFCSYIFLAAEEKRKSLSLQDLIEFCKDNYRNSETKQIKFNKDLKNYSTDEKLFFAKSRVATLCKIVENRYFQEELVGSRHNFLTQMTNCIADVEKHKNNGVDVGYNKILNKLLSFQRTYFKELALPYKEAVSAIKSAVKRRDKINKKGDSTNLGNNVIIKFLNLSSDEADVLRETSIKAKREKIKTENSFSKFQKSILAYELYQNGYKYEDIAKALDFSSSSAHRYVNELYPTYLKEKKESIKREKDLLKKELKDAQQFIYEEIREKVIEYKIKKELKTKLLFKLAKNHSLNKKIDIYFSSIDKSIDKKLKNSHILSFDKIILSITKEIEVLIDSFSF